MARMAKTAKKSSAYRGVVAQQLLDYRAEIDDLRRTVLALTETNTIENVLQNGFATLLTQLEPLQELTPQRTLLSIQASNKLQDLRTSLAQPEWTGAGSLSIPEMRVPFIAEATGTTAATQVGNGPASANIRTAQRFQS